MPLARSRQEGSASFTQLKVPATESEHGWAVARLETCASLQAFGSIPTLSSVEAERGGTARRLESGRDLRVWGSCPPASAWKVNAAGPRTVSKADGALGLGVRFTRLPRRVARTVRGRFAKPKPVVMSPEQVQLLHSPLIFAVPVVERKPREPPKLEVPVRFRPGTPGRYRPAAGLQALNLGRVGSTPPTVTTRA